MRMIEVFDSYPGVEIALQSRGVDVVIHEVSQLRWDPELHSYVLDPPDYFCHIYVLDPMLAAGIKLMLDQVNGWSFLKRDRQADLFLARDYRAVQVSYLLPQFPRAYVN